MKIEIRDFGGIERADIEVTPIALVSGRNAAGKSSVCAGAAAAVTGRGDVEGVAKSEGGMLVRDGTTAASAKVISESGSVQMTWPKRESVGDGTAPWASLYAAGLHSLLDIERKERSAILGGYLKAAPDLEDFKLAMNDAGLGIPEIVDPMWDLISRRDWDGALKERREKGAEMKGRWEEVAGTRYGSQIGRSWKPQGWDLALEHTTEEALIEAEAKAQREHHAAIAAGGAAQNERATLEAEAGKISAYEAQLTSAQGQLGTLRARKAQIPAEIEALGLLAPQAVLSCPHCAGALQVVHDLASTKIIKAPEQPEIDEQTLKARRLRKADLDGESSRIDGEITTANRTIERIEGQLTAAKNAKQKLTEPAEPPKGPPEAVAKAEVERAGKALAMWRSWTRANQIHQRIVSNELLLQILAPEGLRGRKLSRVLTEFNQRLETLTHAARWKPVTVSPDMSLNYGGRSVLLAKSEAYRIRVALQLAMAQLDKSGLVIIDGADILDAPMRGGLVSAVQNAGIPALIAMTLSRPEQMPDLAAAGAGNSYWIDEGVARPLRPEAQAA